MLDQRRRSAWHGLETEAGRRCAAVRRAPARRRMLDEEGRRRPRRPSCAHGVSGRGVRVRTCALVARLELFTQTTTTVCSRPVSPLCVCSVTFSCLLLFGVLSSTSKSIRLGLLVVLSRVRVRPASPYVSSSRALSFTKVYPSVCTAQFEHLALVSRTSHLFASPFTHHTEVQFTQPGHALAHAHTPPRLATRPCRVARAPCAWRVDHEIQIDECSHIYICFVSACVVFLTGKNNAQRRLT